MKNYERPSSVVVKFKFLTKIECAVDWAPVISSSSVSSMPVDCAALLASADDEEAAEVAVVVDE